MTDRATLPPALRRRFRTGSPVLDFAHTGGEGRWVAAELVHSADDVARWLALVLDLTAVEARPSDVAAVRRMRRAIWNIVSARVAGDRLDAADLLVVNERAAGRGLAWSLDAGGRPLLTGRVTTRDALDELARQTVALLSGPLGQRIRVCAADDCELLFVDTSRPGRRLWCSMQRCGNLAKTRNYRRRRTGPPAVR